MHKDLGAPTRFVVVQEQWSVVFPEESVRCFNVTVATLLSIAGVAGVVTVVGGRLQHGSFALLYRDVISSVSIVQKNRVRVAPESERKTKIVGTALVCTHTYTCKFYVSLNVRHHHWVALFLFLSFEFFQLNSQELSAAHQYENRVQ